MRDFRPKKFEPKTFEVGDRIKTDKATDEWFKRNPGARTTVTVCNKCGLWYKPDLGHKCEVK